MATYFWVSLNALYTACIQNDHISLETSWDKAKVFQKHTAMLYNMICKIFKLHCGKEVGGYFNFKSYYKIFNHGKKNV